jgi:SAM-dependent methyltransferase
MNASPTPRAQWDERFGGDGYLYGTEPNDFLRQHVELLPPGEVMCLAEGQGRNAVFLAERGYEVSSVDLSATGVDKTLALATARGVTVTATVADLADVDLGTNRWSAIVSIFAHVPPTVRAEVHGRVADALIPGGIFVLEAYTPAQVGRGTGGPPDGSLTMTLDALRTELSALEFDHAVETEREVIEGVGHTGVGSVVQVIAHRP